MPERPENQPEEGAVAKRSVRTRVADARARTDELRRAAEARFEIEREHRSSVRTAAAFFESDRRFAGGLLAGGLAFRIFLWMLPFSLVLVTLVGYTADFSSTTADQLAHNAGMSAAVASSVSAAVRDSGQGRFFLLMTGLVLLVWMGRSLVRALKVVCNLAWHMTLSTHASMKESAALAGAVLVLSLLPVLAGYLYGGGVWTDLLAGLMLILAFGSVGLWGMIVLPRPERVPWTWLIPGALLLGTGAEVIRLLVSLYFADKLERSSGMYGALGVAVVFLAWLYLVGRLIIASTNLNATLWVAREPQPESAVTAPGDAASGLGSEP
jgi:membrane protein